MTEPLVTASGVARTFGSGETAVPALRDVSFSVGRGQLVVVYGRSGSGKTTLLNIVGGLDTPTAGAIRVAGQDLSAMTEHDRRMMRRTTVAFIFQSFGLIPMLSAAENVGVPLRITGAPPRAREERVATMLSIVGLSEHAAHRPDELSGGQQQRVAIARALAGRPELLVADEPTSQLDLETGRQIMRLLLSVVGLDEHAGKRPAELSGGQQQRVAVARALAGRPELLIADEPTGQLDSETGRQIIRLLRTVIRAEGITALVASHDTELMDLADEVLRLEDGRLVS